MGTDQNSSTPITERNAAAHGPTHLVDPRDAHKRDADNLWITNIVSSGATAMALEFQIPQACSTRRLPDLIEVQRQAGMVFAHKSLDVPHSSVHVLRAFRLELNGIPEAAPQSPLAGKASLTLLDSHSVQGRVRSAHASIEIACADGTRGTGTLTAMFLPPSVYERLRSTQHPDNPIAGALATDRRNERGWVHETVRADSANPLLSDHENDHITAMALVCAIEGSLVRTARASIRALAFDFSEYIEHSPPPQYSYTLTPSGGFDGFVSQSGKTKAAFSGAFPGAFDPQHLKQRSSTL